MRDKRKGLWRAAKSSEKASEEKQSKERRSMGSC